MAIVLALPSMIDLVAPPKEPDNKINYPVLQSLLHVIVQQLGLNKTKVEFRGNDSERIQDLVTLTKGKEGPSMEFKIISAHKERQEPPPHGKEEESENVISDVYKELHAESSKDKKYVDSEVAYIIESGEIIEMEKRKPVQVSFTTFTRLEGKVKLLQAQVESLGIQVIPSDEVLLSQTRSADQATPITDLWQSMNITKRMSGAEEGIDKLASLLETVAKEYADLKLLLDKVQDELGLDVVETLKEIRLAADYAKKMRPRAELYEKALIKRDHSNKGSMGDQTDGDRTQMSLVTKDPMTTSRSNSSQSMASSGGKSGVPDEVQEKGEAATDEEMTTEKAVVFRGEADTFSDIDTADNDRFAMLPDSQPGAMKINNLIMDQELIRRQMEFMTAQINTLADFSEKILPEILEGLPGMEELKRKIASIRDKTGSQATLTSADWEARKSNLSLEQRVEDLESRVSSHASKLRRQDALFCDKYDTVLNQIRDIQGTVTFIKVRFHMDDPNEETANLFDPENIKMILVKHQEITEELTDIYSDIEQLKKEVKKYEEDFSAILEELEGMQSTKVDRFEIDDILADKADCSEVQGKVSSDVFEEFCNSLTKGVDFTIKNTLEQEKQWKKELAKMLQEVEMKFNISEVDPLKDELNKKIDDLSKRLDEVARMKSYALAAGSKRRLYTEVNCIACDKKAAMEIEDGKKLECDKQSKKSEPFINAKPYIAYELDQLKKMKIKNPGAKSLHLHEQIMKNYAISVGFDLLPENEVKFVNRYCGGAETLLNPRQRVAKVSRNDKCKT